MEQFHYLNADGEFDYELYKRVQIAGNRRKLDWQWVDENAVAYLASYITRQTSPSFALCHGTRRGNEQLWFRERLQGCEVIGTEISDTARDFPFTVQWDFHDENPTWLGRADFVYSNSWDHSYDPRRLFPTWAGQLAPGGLLILEHTSQHIRAKELDPFGATLEELIELLNQVLPPTVTFKEVLTDGPGTMLNGEEWFEANYVVFQAHL